MVEWTWYHCWVPLQGAIVVCDGWGGGWRPTLGEWTWWHCRLLWLGGVTANFGGVDVVPLQGAIVVCYGWGGGVDVVPLVEWMWCHCRVPLQWVGGEGDDQLWRSGRGAIVGCRCSVLWWGGGDDQLWGSGRGAFDNTKIGFCYLGSMLV